MDDQRDYVEFWPDGTFECDCPDTDWGSALDDAYDMADEDWERQQDASVGL